MLFPCRVEHFLAICLENRIGVAIRIRQRVVVVAIWVCVAAVVAVAVAVVVVVGAVVIVVAIEILNKALGERCLRFDMLPKSSISFPSSRTGQGQWSGSIERGLLQGCGSVSTMSAGDINTMRATLIATLGAIAFKGGADVARIAVQIFLEYVKWRIVGSKSNSEICNLLT